jgi:hypothetical protein
MSGRKEAINSIRKALAMLDERMPRNTCYGVYIHANEQLGRMLAELGHPDLAPIPKRGWVDVGLMAAKELEAVIPSLPMRSWMPTTTSSTHADRACFSRQ